jgi:hypothetical protein
MTYALINYDMGEILSISGENITCQHLYNRALSQRREAARYCYRLEKLSLIKCYNDDCLTKGSIIQEWEGGFNAPIEDLRLGFRTYWTLKTRQLNTVGSVLDYIQQSDIFRRLPSKNIYKLAEALKPYDRETVDQLVHKLNLRKMNKPLE